MRPRRNGASGRRYQYRRIGCCKARHVSRSQRRTCFGHCKAAFVAHMLTGAGYFQRTTKTRHRTRMIQRTTTRTVTFAHPFTLSGVDGVQPAGSYTVETDEELIQTLSFPAYRSTGTWFRLPAQGRITTSTHAVGLTPAELGAALAKDALASANVPAEPCVDRLSADRVRVRPVRSAAAMMGALNQGLLRLTAGFARIWRR